MGNYSWLLDSINCKNTFINWDIVLEKIKDFPEDNVLSYDIIKNEYENIKTIKDLGEYLHDKKLCGYLTDSYMNILKIICFNTKKIKIENESSMLNPNPILYFEEDSWDRIWSFEFIVGTVTVIIKTHSFSINKNYIKYIYMCENDEYFSSFEEFIESKLYDSDLFDEEIYYEFFRKEERKYMYNLINDKSTTWNNLSELKTNVYMTICGVRPEDIKI